MAGTQEEDATDLQFPKEFENAETLLISEVHKLLMYRKKTNENQEEEQELNERFTKTLNYCVRFSKFENRMTIKAIRTMLTQKKFHKFEAAAIANLCPETPEEAKALIPSLASRFDDEELRVFLEDMATQRSLQS